MVDFGGIIDPNAILQFAGMSDAMGWVGIGVSFLLNVLVGGIVLVVILELLGHHWGEHINPINAFFAVFISSLIAMFGGVVVSGFLGSLGYYGYLLFSLLVWFALIKVFFRDLATKHAVLAALVVFVANMLVVPMVVGAVSGFIGF